MNPNGQPRLLSPKWLKEWLPILAMIGLPVSATWGYVLGYWQSAAGTVSENIQLLLVTLASTVSGLGVLCWYSYRRQKRIDAHRDQKLKLKSAEERILVLFAIQDPNPLPVGALFEELKLLPVEFHYHWNRVFDDYKLLNFTGGHHYMLSQAGRKYVIENNLIKTK